MKVKTMVLGALVPLLAATSLAVAQSTQNSEPARPEQGQPQLETPEQPAESLQVEPAPAPPTRTEDGTVVSVDPQGSKLTVKVGGDQKEVTLDNKAAAALKVMRAGDDVRLFLRNDGKVSGVVITKPTAEASKSSKS